MADSASAALGGAAESRELSAFPPAPFRCGRLSSKRPWVTMAGFSRHSSGTERLLAAIMFTNIVGYTALMARNEEAGRRARDRHEAIVRPLVARHSGRWIEARGHSRSSREHPGWQRGAEPLPAQAAREARRWHGKLLASWLSVVPTPGFAWAPT